jgi:hypothetical protein
MSVIKFEKEEWQKLFNTLVYLQQSNNISQRIRFLDSCEVESEAKLFFKNDIKKTEEYLIALIA